MQGREWTSMRTPFCPKESRSGRSGMANQLSVYTTTYNPYPGSTVGQARAHPQNRTPSTQRPHHSQRRAASPANSTNLPTLNRRLTASTRRLRYLSLPFRIASLRGGGWVGGWVGVLWGAAKYVPVCHLVFVLRGGKGADVGWCL